MKLLALVPVVETLTLSGKRLGTEKYTYDKTTGVITLMGDKQITGDITVDPADYDFTIVDYKVDKKTGL